MNNKKGKGKRPNKPPNPTPPQVKEVLVPETIEKIQTEETNEDKNEQRVPEIISEVQTVVAESKKEECDIPKKPKRNRGKKKKQDKDLDSEESHEEKSVVPSIEENNPPKKIDSVKDDKIELIEKVDDSEISNLTPAVRKKKNKNKKQSQEQLQLEKVELDKDKIITEDVEPVIDDKNKECKPQEQLDLTEVSEQVEQKICNEAIEEVQPSKKKNRKKKHDSEKIDKKEEITVAYQSQTKDNEVCKDLNKQSINTGDNVQKIEEKEEVASTSLEQMIQEEPTVQQVSKDKHKKKKKDKKNISKEDNSPIASVIDSTFETVDKEKLPSSDEKKSFSLPDNCNIEQILIPEDKSATLLRLEEDTMKPKAKIAKPVDKKRKNLKDSLTEDVIITEIPATENIVLSTVESKDLLPAAVLDAESLKISEESTSELSSISQFSIVKKRKKSPKLAVELTKEKEMNLDITQVQKDNTIVTNEPIMAELSIEQQETTKVEVIPDKANIELEDNRVHTTQEVNLEIRSESSKGKKGKKSHKLPIKIENVENKICENKEKEQTVKKTDQNIEKSKDVSDEKIHDLPMEDIEIRSVKADESEGSASEVTPDSIQYPRAISQQNVDNNNNTVIQEIMVIDESRLQIPHETPDTPFIKNVEETIESLELVPSSIKVIESEASIKAKPEEKQEKTDLKSKMIEVNQDMEELRLSIERSLAELTALEKNDDEVEKKMQEESQSKSDKDNVGDKLTEIQEIIDLTESNEGNKNIDENKEIKSIDVISIIEETKKEDIITIENKPIASSELTEHIDDLNKTKLPMDENKVSEHEVRTDSITPPVYPIKKDNKGKSKSKKKGKQETVLNTSEKGSSDTDAYKKESSESGKSEDKTEKKSETQGKGKQQSVNVIENLNENNAIIDNENTNNNQNNDQNIIPFEPIEHFEDAMTSSIDDVNKTFELIVDEAQESQVNPETNIADSTKDKSIKKDEKINPVSPSKNLLGHPDIPVPSNKTDYKKEKNKPPNTLLAKVKIKDSIQIENKKESKESQTDNIKNLIKKKSIEESLSSMNNENDEYIYKYTFRKVFLPNVCHTCKRDLKQSRISCTYCHLLFYCCPKHKDEDWPHHQALCFAVSTIGHLKEQKYIYADAKNITGHNYRLLRMQMIVSCEKVLKRKLQPWEQEVLLYPRICADIACREWRQNKLTDCDGCGQVSYCLEHPEHLTRAHQRWCKSYSLYQKLVCYQQTRGRLEPKLPNRVMTEQYHIPEKINEVLASLYKDKIDMNDIEYAALTQLATAPLTAAYCHQLYTNRLNSTYANGVIMKSSFVIHVVGAELQFEADVLNKWEVFFLHLRPDIQQLRVVLVAPDLNPSNLPLELLKKIKLCNECYRNQRQLLFSFQDKKTYHEYYDSIDFISPDIVCAFNSSIQRSSAYNGKDPWPSTIKCILKLKTPFVITAYTLNELRRDLTRVEEIVLDVNLIAEPKRNPFASVRPDRNFITDDEMPLLFKNYCFSVVCGVY